MYSFAAQSALVVIVHWLALACALAVPSKMQLLPKRQQLHTVCSAHAKQRKSGVGDRRAYLLRKLEVYLVAKISILYTNK